VGVLSPAGNTPDELWTALVEGKCGIERITHFDASAFYSQIAGTVKNFDPLDHFTPKEAKKMDPMSHYALVSARQAVRDSGIDLEKTDPTRIGVLYGSGIGGLTTIEQQHLVLLNRGPTRMSPFLIPTMIIDMTAGQISMEFGAKGPNFSIVSACATGSHTIGEAARIIALGDADIVVSGATEAAVTPLGLGGFSAMKALSRRNDDPEHASRPFDLHRDGFVLAEGSATVVLEEMDHARARGARIYGELIGYGLSGDAHHVTQPAPEGEGAVRSIRMALRHAGIEPGDVDYYNAHGTSTRFNDLFETKALKTVFGEDAYRLPVSSTKAITGHMLAAAGSAELIAVLKAMEHGVIPPTWHYETPDPECDLDYVPNEPRRADLGVCVSNSLGFGGHNATLVVRKV
jgi:3-oxoacyl-[acyl-carrier-protein] synthase II